MNSNANFQSDLVSIITPAYNAEKFITETIKSVLDQTYQKWEMLIVDDCSTDATIDIVKKICVCDKRVILIESEKNGGPAAARNIGLKYAKGQYISFLDSDDTILPEKLDRQIKFMRSQLAAISFSSYRVMSETGEKLGDLIEAVEEVTYEDEMHQTLIGGGTVMIDRRLTGDFEFKSARNEDYLLWLRLLKCGHRAYGLPEDLARYRKLKGSRSSNKLTSAMGVWKIHRQHEELNFFEAAICFCSYAITSLLRNYRVRPR
ncbi:glycosyltransferase family 2 protein [Azotosporobacter soli]|uniref:glycosyltransferase family 2 protein n=1 Tax=Azotosporobacter soli TaxID=3055040 RepID=UPI0031FEEA9A